ncbi:MAG: hypothetical protein HRF46_01665 [Acidobacteriota bacterium]|jgi:septal ring factor EnvC (AmiA/AmiB activator)
MGALPADFHDLVRALEDHPEWRAELRRLVLTDEFLPLPEVVRQLAEAQRRTEERLNAFIASSEERLRGLDDRIAALAEAQRRTDERLEAFIASAEERFQALEAAQRRIEERLEELAAAQRRTEEALTRLTHKVADLSIRVSTLHGDALERRYREKAHAYFARILRRLRVLSSQQLADLVDDALEDGRLTWEERGALLLADVVAEGRTPEKQQAFLLAEVSATISQRDVDRARERADLLTRITGVPTWAVVAGEELAEGIRAYARAAGVWQVLDGHVLSPDETPQ